MSACNERKNERSAKRIHQTSLSNTTPPKQRRLIHDKGDSDKNQNLEERKRSHSQDKEISPDGRKFDYSERTQTTPPKRSRLTHKENKSMKKQKQKARPRANKSGPGCKKHDDLAVTTLGSDNKIRMTESRNRKFLKEIDIALRNDPYGIIYQYCDFADLGLPEGAVFMKKLVAMGKKLGTTVCYCMPAFM